MKFSVIFGISAVVLLCSGGSADGQDQEDAAAAVEDCSPAHQAQVSRYFTVIFMLGDYQLASPRDDNEMKDKCR